MTHICCWDDAVPSGDPIPHDGCVNRILVCPVCGRKVGEESWTAEAWALHIKKQQPAALSLESLWA